jgi:hypothetical protein
MYSENLELADYLKEGDVGFKKPKASSARPIIDSQHKLILLRQRRSGLPGGLLQSPMFLPPTAMLTWKSTKSPLFPEHETSTLTSSMMTNYKRPLHDLDG